MLGQDLGDLVAHPHQEFPGVPPPLPCKNEMLLIIVLTYVMYLPHTGKTKEQQ